MSRKREQPCQAQILRVRSIDLVLRVVVLAQAFPLGNDQLACNAVKGVGARDAALGVALAGLKRTEAPTDERKKRTLRDIAVIDLLPRSLVKLSRFRLSTSI